jgi:hypothetical protein
MPNDATSPAAGTAGENTPLSFEESVETLTNLDLDDTPDLQEEDEGQEGVEGDGPDDATAQDEDPVGEAGQDGSQEVAAGGKFVSQDAKVRLQDGTVITVGELARNNLFQRDYTTKTTELKAERETFNQQRTKVETFAQQIMQEREFFLQAAQQLLPQPPDESLISSEPLEYMAQKAAYERSLGLFQQLQYQHQTGLTRKQEETLGQTQEARKREAERLFETMPELKQPGAYKKFWGEAVETMAEYGFTEAELNDVNDHRMYKAMRDLAKYRRAAARAPKVAEQVQGKPKLISGGKRMDPKGKEVRNRQSLAEQQRRTGSLEDTVKRLESLI